MRLADARTNQAEISWVVSMVLILGILGSGLFGAGVRAVQEREANILRRYKVAPEPVPNRLVARLHGCLEVERN